MTAVVRLAGALILTVAIGLASRAWPIGFVVWDEVVGDALYAVALYLVIAIASALLRRTWGPQVIGGIAVGLCWAIEAFQATGWTARSVSSANLRHVLGTTFGFTDLIWYLIGVVAIALVDAQWLRPERGARPGGAPDLAATPPHHDA
jgi:uncharacterized membrane protein YedE/YeeE